jgi:hypothetical protein
MGDWDCRSEFGEWTGLLPPFLCPVVQPHQTSSANPLVHPYCFRISFYLLCGLGVLECFLVFESLVFAWISICVFCWGFFPPCTLVGVGVIRKGPFCSLSLLVKSEGSVSETKSRETLIETPDDSNLAIEISYNDLRFPNPPVIRRSRF